MSLSSWKSKFISFECWLTLVISVVGNMPLYQFSLFKAPVSVINVQGQYGSKTLFWLDDWIGRGTLASRSHYQHSELMELDHICNLLRNFTLSNVEDVWNSLLTINDIFYVNNLRQIINSKLTRGMDNPTILLKLIPHKFIPTATAPVQRGVSIHNTSCNRCHNVIDAYDHILVGCSYARKVLWWIFGWCDVPYCCFNSAKEAIDFAINWGRCPKKTRLLICNILFREVSYFRIMDYGALRYLSVHIKNAKIIVETKML
uniref:Reverse transcriptase zinc-binding domain-containing protein n=1 Tax=Lactuca sativa TaxID=4236 RepID=A0A9R1XNC4_LACSA|nr:hypothetical protein LSAT_V11C300128180 [Lactuca sativa]